MTGIPPVNNIYSNNLVFHGEGQTFSASPLLAPGRVAAFEATNLRTLEQEKSREKQGKQSMMRYLIYGPSIPIGLLVSEAA